VAEGPTEHRIKGAGVALAAGEVGTGPPVVLLHGLTATRRYVVMGSRLLERSGHRVIGYDARGHGHSTPAPDHRAYGYEQLAGDLKTVMDALGIERAVLAGASMGAHTIARFALDNPARVAAMALITPAYEPGRHDDRAALAHWDRLAAGLREGGVEGFVAAYPTAQLPPAWRETLLTGLRQRLSAHDHPGAVADALSFVPRSRPFATAADLQRIDAPAIVVGDRDEADAAHPLAVARAYAELIPRARMVLEEPGHAPIAWQGGQLSRVLLELAAQARWA